MTIVSYAVSRNADIRGKELGQQTAITNLAIDKRVSLREVLKSECPLVELLELMKKICECVNALHDFDIVLGNLCSATVFLSNDTQVCWSLESKICVRILIISFTCVSLHAMFFGSVVNLAYCKWRVVSSNVPLRD